MLTVSKQWCMCIFVVDEVVLWFVNSWSDDEYTKLLWSGAMQCRAQWSGDDVAGSNQGQPSHAGDRPTDWSQTAAASASVWSVARRRDNRRWCGTGWCISCWCRLWCLTLPLHSTYFCYCYYCNSQFLFRWPLLHAFLSTGSFLVENQKGCLEKIIFPDWWCPSNDIETFLSSATSSFYLLHSHSYFFSVICSCLLILWILSISIFERFY